MWYYEERTALGRWSPRTEPGQPSAVSASGTKRTIRAVREVPANMTGYDLNVLRDWSDALIAKEADEAALKAAQAAAPDIPEVTEADFKRMRVETPAAHLARQAGVRVKPLSWREIDPGFRFVGTGLGFTCEVHRLHKGGWEAIWPLSNAEFPDALAAKAAMEAAYAAMVLSFVEVVE